jgi:hypothetical protein
MCDGSPEPPCSPPSAALTDAGLGGSEEAVSAGLVDGETGAGEGEWEIRGGIDNRIGLAGSLNRDSAMRNAPNTRLRLTTKPAPPHPITAIARRTMHQRYRGSN